MKDDLLPVVLDLKPLAVEVGSSLSFLLNRPAGKLADVVEKLRTRIALESGVILPEICCRENQALQPKGFSIKIKEVEVARGEVKLPLPSMALSCIVKKLQHALRGSLHEFLGPEEVHALLEFLKRSHPKLIERAASELPILEIHRLLHNLVKEGIPIRDMVNILEIILSPMAPKGDPDFLTEFVRGCLPRLISSQCQEKGIMRIFTLTSGIEEKIAGAIHCTEWGCGLAMDEDAALVILYAVEEALWPYLKQEKLPVILTRPEVRRYVRLLLETSFPSLPVLSLSEVAKEFKIKQLGTISLEKKWWQGHSFLQKAVRFVSRRPAPPRKLKEGTIVAPLKGFQKAAYFLLSLSQETSNDIFSRLPPADQRMIAQASTSFLPPKEREAALEEFCTLLEQEGRKPTWEEIQTWAREDPQTVAQHLKEAWLTAGRQNQEEQGSWQSAAQATLLSSPTVTVGQRLAVFISGAPRWIQEEVLRQLQEDEVLLIGQGMASFPSLSPAQKKKAWEECEGYLYRDDWWDPDTLAKFIHASIHGNLEEFRKRRFRGAQKIAALILCLPPRKGEEISTSLFRSLSRNLSQAIVVETGQWRDWLPAEVEESALEEFLEFASHLGRDQVFLDAQLLPEAERVVSQAPAGAASLMKEGWLVRRDPKPVYHEMALQSSELLTRALVAFARSASPQGIWSPQSDLPLTGAAKAAIFLRLLHPEVSHLLKEHGISEGLFPEKGPSPAISVEQRKRVLSEFLHLWYSSQLRTPLQIFSHN